MTYWEVVGNGSYLGPTTYFQSGNFKKMYWMPPIQGAVLDPGGDQRWGP